MYKSVWQIGESNKSAIFVLPMLADKCREFHGSSLPQSQFRNCFIGDRSKDISNRILLLYKFSVDPIYLEFEGKLERHTEFETRYEVDKFHTMFVFKIPDGKQEDYNNIILGKYFKVSDSYKEKILSFHALKRESNTGGVLYRLPFKKDLLEAKINDGLPKVQWTKIPDEVDLEEAFNNEIEYFQEKYRIKTVISPNESFHKTHD